MSTYSPCWFRSPAEPIHLPLTKSADMEGWVAPPFEEAFLDEAKLRQAAWRVAAALCRLSASGNPDRAHLARQAA